MKSKIKKARINELTEVLQQINRTKNSLESSMITTDIDFAEAHNMGLEYAIRHLNIDIMTIETKIKLIEDEKI